MLYLLAGCGEVMAHTELLAPKLYEYASIMVELSLHKPSNAYKNELVHIFPSLNEKMGEILVIPTMQKTCIELVNWGDVADRGIYSLTSYLIIATSAYLIMSQKKIVV